MEKIIVNVDAQEKLINETATNAIKEVTRNAENGIGTTDLYFPKSISHAVRDRLEEMLKVSNTRFSWCVVARGCNEYTGKPQSYISESMGEERHYKLQIL